MGELEAMEIIGQGGGHSRAILLRLRYASISSRFTPSTWAPRRDMRLLAGIISWRGPILTSFSFPFCVAVAVSVSLADFAPGPAAEDVNVVPPLPPPPPPDSAEQPLRSPSFAHPSTKPSIAPKNRTSRRKCSPCLGASRVRKRAR
jgi:hypothetical protein